MHTIYGGVEQDVDLCYVSPIILKKEAFKLNYNFNMYFSYFIKDLSYLDLELVSKLKILANLNYK